MKLSRRSLLGAALGTAGASLLGIKTKEARATPKGFVRLAVGGDFHLGTNRNSHRSSGENLTRYASVINSFEPNLVIHLGDLTMHSDFHLVNEYDKKFAATTWWIIGNHDLYDDNWKELWPTPEQNYWWEFHGWAFITINNNPRPHKKSREYWRMKESCEWLRDTIDSIDYPPERRILFAHVPFTKIYKCHPGKTKQYLSNLETEMYEKIRVAYFGHHHASYASIKPGSVPYYVAGYTTVVNDRHASCLPGGGRDNRAVLIVDLYEDGRIKNQYVTL